MAKQKKNFSPGSIKIERQKCKGCELCIESCPRGLLTLEKALNKRGVRPVHYKGGICTGCALCALICPESCIQIFK